MSLRWQPFLTLCALALIGDLFAGASTALAGKETQTTIPDRFTIPAGSSVPVFAYPGGPQTGTFEVELDVTVVAEQDGYLQLSYIASNGNRYQAWVWLQDVQPFFPGSNAAQPGDSSRNDSLPDAFTYPGGYVIDSYDGPNGNINGSFRVPLVFHIIEEVNGFLHVSWKASNGNTYYGWVKLEDVKQFIWGSESGSGQSSQCPFTFQTYTYTPTTFPTPDAGAPLGVMTFEAVVDLSSEPVTLQQVEATMQDASNILYNLTNFVIRLQGYTTVTFTGIANLPDQWRNNIPQCYIDQKSGDIPDALVVFSYGADDYARAMGGYAFTVTGPPGFHNHFIDPWGNDNLVYTMINHHSHKYARCGYDDTGENIISNVSVDGECQNQPGTACVMHNGYSMCSTAVNNLYASTPNYFSAATVIHEIMHSFGVHANLDHYGTQECITEMGWDSSWVYHSADAEWYNGMCPYVYANFVAGYQPIP